MSALISPRLAAAHRQLRGWLAEVALNYWAKNGVDREKGGFFERIDKFERPTDEPRRTRLAARQIYVFTKAKHFRWIDEADALVAHGLDFFKSHCLMPSGNVRVSVSPDGLPQDDSFELYDHAFALFALAEVRRQYSGRREAETLAGRISTAMVTGWKHPLFGFERSSPRTLPLEANPHMHLLEAFLAWMEVCPSDQVWEKLAQDIVTLCLDRLIDPASGALREFWDGDWRPMPDESGQIVEPGHQFEWAWLLLRWGQITGCHRSFAAAARLIDIGEKFGVASNGLVIAELWHRDLSIKSGHFRLWPLTERVKALMQMAALTPDKSGRARFEAATAAAIEAMLRFLRHPTPGLWHDLMYEDGSFDSAPTKASSLYHIVCCYCELENYVS